MDQRVNGSLVLIGSVSGTAAIQAQPSGGNFTLQLPNSLPQPGQFVAVTNISPGNVVTIGWTNSLTGTVTGVALAVPAFLTVTGSPINTSGTFTIGLATQSSNTVFAGPTSGGGVPTFRALVAADIPIIAQSQVTGLVTALTAKANVASPTFTGTATFASISVASTFTDGLSSVGTNGQILSSTGTGVVWIDATAGSSSFNSITSGSNTTATMTLGSGGTLTFSGTGVVNANQLAGVVISSTPSAGNVLTATSPTAAHWVAPSGGLPSRASIGFTTSLLGAGAIQTTTVTMAKSFMLLSVQVNKKARVELYSTAAAQAADAARPIGTPPTPGTAHGVICDLALPSAQTFIMSPSVIGACMESVVTTSITYAITNTDVTSQAVTVAFVYVALES